MARSCVVRRPPSHFHIRGKPRNVMELLAVSDDVAEKARGETAPLTEDMISQSIGRIGPLRRSALADAALGYPYSGMMASNYKTLALDYAMRAHCGQGPLSIVAAAKIYEEYLKEGGNV